MRPFLIREIGPEDNRQVANLIRKVLEELGVVDAGTAYTDKAIDAMYETYAKPRAVYLVVIQNEEVLGCAGIGPLENHGGNICELQKMYLLSQVRGQGIGAALLEECISYAKNYGYEGCYLETMPHMKAAQKLYQKNGFEYIEDRLGDTGHYSCPVWMLKKF